MQHLDNDIDDLFIKAAEGYSVKMPDDWDTIASRLTDNDANKTSSFNWLKTGLVIVLVSALNVLAIELKDSKLMVTANKTILSNNISSIVKNKPTKLATTSFKLRNSLKGNNNAAFEQEVTDYLSASRLTLFDKNNKLMKGDYSQINQSTPTVPLVPTIDTNSNNDVEKNKLTTIITNKTDTTVPNALTLNEEISTENKNVAAKTEVKKTSNKFYVGLQSGISFNQIKSQGFTKPGYNIGVIVGKAFNKNWAVESGIILTTKSYHTDGQYFNKTKAASSMPAGFKVKSLDGNCTLLEVPLTVKLNFGNKKNKGSFYTNAGIATYITLSEHNNYFASINGGTPINVEASYNDKAYQVLGAIQLGFGYENKISNKLNIRVEPYLQIPLSGIGIGALPVTTAGLRIGFSSNR